ncbi:MAG: YjdF family protein [Lactobacillus sp.]|nr:YjdF family protein [Lactobacillus sp.]
MYTIKSALTIVYEPPFYKAIFERRFGSTYEVGQVNLGSSEPKLTLVYNLVIHHWNKIIFFKQTVCDVSFSRRKINPKRLQRLAKRSVEYGISTKAQKTLQKQMECQKLAQRRNRCARKVLDQERRYKMRQAKKIQKHKGH